MDATPQDSKQVMQEAFDRFVKVIEEARKKHAETTGTILREINEMRIKEIREKLGLK